MWTVLGEVSSEYVFIIVVTDSLFFLSNVMIMKIPLEPFDVSVSVKECLSITSLTRVGNFLSPLRGGTIGKAVYLKERYTFPYMTFIAATSAVTLINFSLAALLGGIAILMIGYSSHPLLAVFLSFFVAVNLLLCSLLFSPGRLENCGWKVFDRLSGVIKGMDLILRDRKLIIKISFLMFGGFLLGIAELALSYGAFLIDISLAEATLIDAISLSSGIMKILPANLAVYEGSIALSSQILGIGFGEGLLAAGLVRAVSVFVMLIFGLLFGLRSLAGKQTSGTVDSTIGRKRTT